MGKHYDWLQTAGNRAMRNEATADVARMFLASLGVGAVGRGSLGLARLLHRNVLRNSPPVAGPLITPIPFRGAIEEEEGEEKQAQDPVANAGRGLADWWHGVTSGRDVDNKLGLLGYTPAMLLAGAGGLGLGWAGIDKILDARRTAAQKKELEQSQREFESALIDRLPRVKVASDASAGDRLSARLDELYDHLVKCAQQGGTSHPNPVSTAAGALGGAYLGYATLSSLLAGYLGYGMGRKSQRRALLEAAQKKRRQMAASASPSEVYAVPVVH